VEEVLELITQKLEAMISAGDRGPICSKHKTITALFSYALWQEQNGQHKVLDVCLHAARASKRMDFLWHCIKHLPIAMLLNEESSASTKQAFILMSPHLLWQWGVDEHWVQAWATAASTVPHTEEVGQSVADVLLHIASCPSLQSHIPPEMWSWLRKSPSLPQVCAGRFQGARLGVTGVQGLGDMETLTAYLLLVWSKWENLATDEIYGLIRGSFSGIRMGYYRKELLQYLDHVLGQLELWLDHLQQHVPQPNEANIQWRQSQYETLRKVLLKTRANMPSAGTCYTLSIQSGRDPLQRLTCRKGNRKHYRIVNGCRPISDYPCVPHDNLLPC